MFFSTCLCFRNFSRLDFISRYTQRNFLTQISRFQTAVCHRSSLTRIANPLLNGISRLVATCALDIYVIELWVVAAAVTYRETERCESVIYDRSEKANGISRAAWNSSLGPRAWFLTLGESWVTSDPYSTA